MNRTLALSLIVAFAVACSGGGEPSAVVTPAPGASPGALPSGPAVLVADGYQAPKDKVDSTGAFVPANGKPTLVWVDAIW